MESFKRFRGEVDMTTKTYVYRGVKYTKDSDNQHVNLKHELHEKVYRGAKYLKLQVMKHTVCDHVYRGAHYMA
jgi:hypothetical protein